MSAARNRANAAWLRAQLESLRFVAAVREIPHHEWRQAIAKVLRGESWQVMPDQLTPDQRERAEQRARHTCVRDMSSRSCRACNSGEPYPHRTPLEIERGVP